MTGRIATNHPAEKSKSVRQSLEKDIHEAFEAMLAVNGRPSRLPKDHPAIQKFVGAWKALDRFDFGPPMRRVYSVAAFAEQPSNILQSIGRAIYYRKPSRFHVLLPCLGAMAPARPGARQAGWFLQPAGAS